MEIQGGVRLQTVRSPLHAGPSRCLTLAVYPNPYMHFFNAWVF